MAKRTIKNANRKGSVSKTNIKKAIKKIQAPKEPILDVNQMTAKEFRELPHRNWDENIEFDSMIILPGKSIDIHDSGYRNMDFAAVRGNRPFCLLAGGSDVIHIDGIGGFGKDWLNKYKKCPSAVPPRAWSIDCLPKSGLLRIWPTVGKMTCGGALSSFEIYSIEKEKKDE